MPIHILDERNLRQLPVKKRLDKCTSIIKTSKDESLRWDAVYIAGEIAENTSNDSPIFGEIADLMTWVMRNDDNGVVKHEACFQIAARNMRNKIPDLIHTAFYDKSIIARHEAIESLGLMRAFDSQEMISKAMKDPIYDVQETAAFVLKRFKRLKKLAATAREYKQSDIL